MNNSEILYLIYFIIFLLIYSKRNGVKKILFFVAFLLITPWCLQLFKSGSQVIILEYVQNINQFAANLSASLSTNFLFFMGDKNKLFGTRETGPFYIFQILLIVLGFWKIISRKITENLLILIWFLAAVALVSLINRAGTFSGGIWYFLPLQLISFIGAEYLYAKYLHSGFKLKLFIILFLMFAIYETANFMHIFFIHYPKRLLLP